MINQYIKYHEERVFWYPSAMLERISSGINGKSEQRSGGMRISSVLGQMRKKGRARQAHYKNWTAVYMDKVRVWLQHKS